PMDVAIPVGNTGINPGGANGRIVLAAPALTGNPLQDTLQEGWLYALVVTTGDHLQGLYMTKDFGLNWTKLRLAARRPTPTTDPSIPTNDYTVPDDYDVLGNSTFAQGNYDVTLAVDPNNPNITYVGGTLDGNPYGFLRVDATKVEDAYMLVAYNNSKNDGGLIQCNTTGGVSVKPPPPPGPGPGAPYGILPTSGNTPRPSYLNQLREPNDNSFNFNPFVV